MKNSSKIFVAVAVTLAVVLSLIAVIVAVGAPSTAQAPSTLGDSLPPNPIATQGITFGQNHGVNDNWISGTISRGQNQGFWKNPGPTSVIVDYSELQSTGTASSSYYFYMGTSTASSVTNNFSIPYSALIDSYSVATSSGPRVVNSDANAGTNGQGSVVVPVGGYVIFGVQQRYNTACTGSVCETATSTNRGFNLNWALQFHYPTTN